MGLSRRTIGVAPLVAGALMFFYALLVSEPSEAQQGDSTGQNDEGCADPQTLDTFTGTESQRTPSFEVTGNTLRLSFETEATSPDAIDENLAIRVIDEAGGFVDSVLVLEPQISSDNIFVDPGTYSLQLDAGQDVRYSVTVEDCTGTAPGTPPAATPTTPTPKAAPAPKATPKQKEKVMRETVPKRPLAPTGGVPVSYMVYGFVLGGASLLALGLVRR